MTNALFDETTAIQLIRVQQLFDAEHITLLNTLA